MILLLLLAVVDSSFGAPECYKCASSGLRTNWALTGFVAPPNDIWFTDSCYSTATSPPPITTCDSGPCLEMLIPVAGNRYEMLRGCYKDFTTSMPEGTKELAHPGVPPAEANDASINHACTLYAVNTYYINGTNLVNLCQVKTAAAAGNSCNKMAQVTGSNVLITDDDRSKCTLTVSEVTCQQCQYFDGRGGCSSDTNNPAKGPACAKTRGTLAGRTYEERSATYVLPYDISGSTKCFDISGKKNATLHFGAFSGTTIFRNKRSISKRSVAPLFDGTTCYCTGEKCNGSPMMAGLPATILLLLTVLPFFS